MLLLFKAGENMIKWQFNEKEEKGLIEQIASKFGGKEIFTGKKIIFAKQNKVECFLISKELEEALKTLKMNPYTIGLYLGEIGKEFQPSLQFLHELAKYADNVIELKDKDEKEFTYGSDLKNTYGKRGLFIVRNKAGVLGLADFEEYKVRNKLDVGSYLRTQR